MPTQAVATLRRAKQPLICTACVERREARWRKQKRMRVLTAVGVGALVLAFIAVSVALRSPDESRWCEAARDAAEGPSSAVIGEVGVEEAVSTAASRYEALAAMSDSASLRRAALDARPVDYSGLSTAQQAAARERLSRHFAAECTGTLRF